MKTDETAESWVDVGACDDVSEGTAIEVVVSGQVIAIFRFEGKLFALDGMCAHQGGPIAEGTIEHGCVTCPWHGWQYELDSGVQTINRQPLQQVFSVRETAGRIQVKPD